VGKEVDRVEFTREDRTRYRAKVRANLDALTRMLATAPFDSDRPLTGLEIELNLVDDQAEPAMRNATVLEAIADPAFVTELGQWNIEINVPLEVLDAGKVPRLGELTLHNGTIYRWNRPVYAVADGRPHLRVENRVLPAGPRTHAQQHPRP
jgi:hypothetical protein